jgi:serine/threonine protein kinase
MIFNKHPFEDETSSQYNMCKKICACQYEFPVLDTPADPNAIDLIKKLLTREPKKRLGCGKSVMEGASSNGFDKLKNHPYLKDIDYGNIYNEKGLKIMKTLASKNSAGESQVMTEGSSFNSTQGNLTVHSRKTIEILAKVDTKRKKFMIVEVVGCLILLSDSTIRYDQTYDNSSVGYSQISVSSR